MKLIPLTQGQFAMIDDADFEAVSQFKWHASKSCGRFYAKRGLRKSNGKLTTQFLHHFLMPGVSMVDHIDGNSLNDQRENMRPATYRQNARGFRRKAKGKTSKFRGVYWKQKNKKWVASLVVHRKTLHLGIFKSETDAAHAYDSAALFYHGEWASTNFPVGEIRIT